MVCPKIKSNRWNYYQCYKSCPLYNGKECNNQGICIEDGKCECSNGYSGKICNLFNIYPNTLYFYDTVLSFQNMFNKKGDIEKYNKKSPYTFKIIPIIPGSSWQDTTIQNPNPWYGLPQTQLTQKFVNDIEKLRPIIDESINPKKLQINNWDPRSNNFIKIAENGNWKNCPLCSTTIGELPREINLDLTTVLTYGLGSPVEYWLTKNPLYGLLNDILYEAKKKNKNEFWIFSLSWGTPDICYIINREKNRFGLDIPDEQTCEGLGLSNIDYINECEKLFKVLTQEYRCIFFIASGDSGCFSKVTKPDGSTDYEKSNYAVDYPASSQYTISVGGVSYNMNCEAGNCRWKDFAKQINKNSTGFYTKRNYGEPPPPTLVGGLSNIDNYGTITGAGFRDINDKEPIPVIDKFINDWYNDKNISKPKDWKFTDKNGDLEINTNWNFDNPPVGSPDIAAIMNNGASTQTNQPSNIWDTNIGTSFSAPVMSAFFAVLLSNASMEQMDKFINVYKCSLRLLLYSLAAKKNIFIKNSKKDKNTWTDSFENNFGILPLGGKVIGDTKIYRKQIPTKVEGFECYDRTIKKSKWDPASGLGVPDYREILDMEW